MCLLLFIRIVAALMAKMLDGPQYMWVASCRGVQYVHWVMHKCIMVKVGGNEIHRKYIKTR